MFSESAGASARSSFLTWSEPLPHTQLCSSRKKEVEDSAIFCPLCPKISVGSQIIPPYFLSQKEGPCVSLGLYKDSTASPSFLALEKSKEAQRVGAIGRGNRIHWPTHNSPFWESEI